jgi:acetyl-CoA carboxylase biotin carboxyl carrier protein
MAKKTSTQVPDAKPPRKNTGGSAGAGADLDVLREMIELLEKSTASSIKLSRGDASYEVAKFPGGAPAMMPALPHVHAHALHAPAPAAGPAPAGGPAPAAPAASNLIEIKSPMVGTYYRAPEPGADPYVKPGSRVSVGQTLCIIEAMKIMNEIESEISGVVRDVLVEDAQPVEFGQVLFRVEPNV